MGFGIGNIISGIASVAGGLIGSKSQSDNYAANLAQQTKFAKNGIQWKVEDAKKAGIHPLYALGANTHSFSPISLNGNPLGEAISSMGQNLGRAASAYAGRKDRALMQQGVQLDIRKKQLENELLETQINAANAAIGSQAPGTPPALDTSAGTVMPPVIPGQPITATKDLTETIPVERTATMPNRPSTEAGAVADTSFVQTGKNTFVPVMSSKAKERYEEDLLGTFGYNMRNRLMPSLGINVQKLAPPKKWLPKGFSHWGYNPFTQEFYPAKKKGWFVW